MYQLLWTEGSLLGQQHLQLWQARYDNLIQNFCHLDANDWGIIDLQLSENALTLGRIHIITCIMLLKNKQLICIDEKNYEYIATSLQLQLPADKNKCTLYLRVPASSKASGISGYPKVEKEIAGLHAKYINIEDAYDSNRNREVAILSPNIILSIEKSNEEFYTYIQIYNLVKESECWQISNDALSPSLKINTSKSLQRKFNYILNNLKKWLEILQQQLEVLSLINIEIVSNNKDGQRLYSEIVKVILLLENYLKTKNTKVLSVVNLLQQAVAAIQGILNLKKPLPQYIHENQYQSIKDLENCIVELIEISRKSKVKKFKFNKQLNNIWEATLDFSGTELKYDDISGIGLKSEKLVLICKAEKEFQNWETFLTCIKVGFASNINHIVMHFISGMKLSHLKSRSHAGLSYKTAYYIINVNKKEIQQLLEEQKIAVFKPRKFDDIEITIMIVSDSEFTS